MVKRRIKKLVNDYYKILIENSINVEKIILFGSHALRKQAKDSDIDLCVVSKSFGKDRFSESVLLLNLSSKISTLIEPIPLSLNDYKHDNLSPIVSEIRRHGIVII